MSTSHALIIEPAASWRRLQQYSEFLFQDLDAQMKEQHRQFLEALKQVFLLRALRGGWSAFWIQRGSWSERSLIADEART